MPKPKHSLREPDTDNRLLDERGGTKERLAKTEWDVGDTGVVTVRQSPIERAVKRGTFTSRQGLAAEKFYVHWYRASMAGSVGSADLLKIFGTGLDFARLGASEQSETHYRCYIQAVKKIYDRAEGFGAPGPLVMRLVHLVLCDEIDLQEAGFRIGRTNPKKAYDRAETWMKSALNVLIEHWGL